jgi:hypothetical protein
LRNDVKSDEMAVRQLEQAGWSLWVVGKKQGRVIASSKLSDLVKLCQKDERERNDES